MTLSERMNFSSPFVGWVAKLNYSVSSNDDRLVVANTGGEIRYYIGETDGRFVLTNAC